jgi:hypothetical protein
MDVTYDESPEIPKTALRMVETIPTVFSPAEIPSPWVSPALEPGGDSELSAAIIL